MRETRLSGSEGGGTGNLTGPPYPYPSYFFAGLIADQIVRRFVAGAVDGERSLLDRDLAIRHLPVVVQDEDLVLLRQRLRQRLCRNPQRHPWDRFRHV